MRQSEKLKRMMEHFEKNERKIDLEKIREMLIDLNQDDLLVKEVLKN